ncbi:hypothetical protein GQ42DRAFT_161788 [Ramicandelaber brevisporus]|nr:hypothetical protein GQ42DRAFT_161788 [Ramicandelaber brevisporus]
MTSDGKQQPDELEQQQQQRSTLPLVYLPIELAEEISSYFDEWSAVNVLRVNSSFYNLFLPRMWLYLGAFTVFKDDETKQHMIEKYGHLVRIIDLIDDVVKRFKINWLPFVKRATHLRADIRYDTTDEKAQMLMKLIRQNKMLQKLEFRFSKYDTPVKLDELAAAINGLEYLEGITCDFWFYFYAEDIGEEWKQAARFIDFLHPSKRSKLKLNMWINTVFNVMDVQALAPYIVKLETYGNRTCRAYLADKFFGIRGNDGQPLVFPQLKELSMTSCCFNIEGYGVKSVSASQFPRLKEIDLNTDSCSLLGHMDPKWNIHETCNWKPEYSGYAHVIMPSKKWQCLTDLTIGIVSSSILMNIIDLNPQLQRLKVGSDYLYVPKENDASKYNHDEFQLDAILDRLPHLVGFLIGRLNSRVAADPAAIPLKRRHSIDIIIGCQMSISPSAAAYILQMPWLINLSFIECVFTDVDETIQLLQSSAATCGVKWFRWNPIEWDQELALTVTEKMPRLKQFIARKCPEEHRAVFEAKYRLYY